MKTGVKAIVFVALILLVVGTSFATSTNPPFAATCQDVLTYGYRDGTDLFGKPMEESWTTDEHFHMTWKFIYEGGEHITIDDKQAYIVSQHSGVLIAIEGSINGFASGVWAYTIHVGMQRIVASQVNAAGSFDNSKLQEVKARSVNLSGW